MGLRPRWRKKLMGITWKEVRQQILEAIDKEEGGTEVSSGSTTASAGENYFQSNVPTMANSSLVSGDLPADSGFIFSHRDKTKAGQRGRTYETIS